MVFETHIIKEAKRMIIELLDYMERTEETISTIWRCAGKSRDWEEFHKCTISEEE